MKEVTLVFHLNLKPIPADRDRGYIFAYSDDGISITAFIKGTSLFFGIPKRNALGLPEGNELIDFIEVPVELGKPVVVSFYCSNNNDTSTLEIYLGTDKIGTKDISSNSPTVGITQISYTLASSINNDNYGYFSLYEMMSYSRMLTAPELSQIINYINNKGIAGYVDFLGNQFMYRDLNTGKLVQPNTNHQPKHVVAA